jgi:type IV secretory pathway TrbL component
MKLVYLAACGASALCLAASVLAQTQSPSSGAGQPSTTPSSPSSGQSGSSAGGTSAGGSAAAGGASAARGSVPVMQNQTRKQKFDQLDANHDGSISRQEAAAAPELVIIFATTDANSDGGVNAVEFEVVPLVSPDGTSVK